MGARLAIGIACLGLLAPVAASAAPSDVEALRSFMRQAMEETAVRGASVALLRGGQLVWLEGFGVRDQRGSEPVTPQTVFQAASLGKVVAAYAALLRVQDGEWRLEMPVSSQRMDVSPGCETPSLAALLSHTAGLGNDLRAERFEPACHPPAPFAYSGQGYLVLQELFGDDAGRSAESFVRERVFEPLAMSTASYEQPSVPDRAMGHADAIYAALTGTGPGVVQLAAAVLGVLLLAGTGLLALRSWRRRARLLPVALIGIAALGLGALGLAGASLVFVPVAPWDTRTLLAASLHASAEDLAAFAGELLSPRLASPTTRDLLFEPRAPIDEQLAWGAGLGIDRVETGDGLVTSYWQWGSNPGFQGLLVLVPERGDAIVVLTNTGGFADVVLGHRGGYALAKRLARRALSLDGRWDLMRGAPTSR